MNIEKRQTETYVITGLVDLDTVTTYVTNYALGQGKLVIECYGESWAHYWGAMGERTLQEFVIGTENAYLLGKLLKETRQTDFDEINEQAHKRGVPNICVTSDFEVAMEASEMERCFGPDWYMDLPRCYTAEYHYLGRILNAVKAAFNDELRKAA